MEQDMMITLIKEAIDKEIEAVSEKIITEAVEKFDKEVRSIVSNRVGILLEAEAMMSFERNGVDLRIIIHDRFKK